VTIQSHIEELQSQISTLSNKIEALEHQTQSAITDISNTATSVQNLETRQSEFSTSDQVTNLQQSIEELVAVMMGKKETQNAKWKDDVRQYVLCDTEDESINPNQKYSRWETRIIEAYGNVDQHKSQESKQKHQNPYQAERHQE
jgi:phage shock protein A